MNYKRSYGVSMSDQILANGSKWTTLEYKKGGAGLVTIDPVD
jgi:hypothetical protein